MRLVVGWRKDLQLRWMGKPWGLGLERLRSQLWRYDVNVVDLPSNRPVECWVPLTGDLAAATSFEAFSSSAFLCLADSGLSRSSSSDSLSAATIAESD